LHPGLYWRGGADPNLNRFLKNKDIDIELHTAGQYKRTLTMLGENTEEGRQKFREDLNETHHLFKDFVHQMRPRWILSRLQPVNTGTAFRRWKKGWWMRWKPAMNCCWG
jgi:ClpP class serine protease